MQTIPMPDVLDADNALINLSDADPASARALRSTTEYAQQLWRQLQIAREYLLTTTTAGRATPAGPYDEPGWRDWKAVYAGITSTLAGPRGDSGFGLSEAELESRWRRTDDQPDHTAAKGGV
jgi:hypothetical protein